MSTIIRVYCQSDEPPALSDMLEWLVEENYSVSLEADMVQGNPDSPEWLSGDFLLEETGESIQLDCVRDEGESANEFQVQCDQFENKIEDLEEVGESDPVRDHLAAAHFFIRLQIPADSSEELLEILDLITQMLAANESGIIHYEGEGIYDSEGESLLELG